MKLTLGIPYAAKQYQAYSMLHTKYQLPVKAMVIKEKYKVLISYSHFFGGIGHSDSKFKSWPDSQQGD